MNQGVVYRKTPSVGDFDLQTHSRFPPLFLLHVWGSSSRKAIFLVELGSGRVSGHHELFTLKEVKSF